MINGFMFEMSPDKFIIERKVYNMGDWLEEIGGFQQIIYVIFLATIPILNVWSIDKHFIEKIYKK